MIACAFRSVTVVFRGSLSSEALATVFIPTSPNPTTDHLQILKRADLSTVKRSELQPRPDDAS